MSAEEGESMSAEEEESLMQAAYGESGPPPPGGVNLDADQVQDLLLQQHGPVASAPTPAAAPSAVVAQTGAVQSNCGAADEAMPPALPDQAERDAEPDVRPRNVQRATRGRARQGSAATRYASEELYAGWLGDDPDAQYAAWLAERAEEQATEGMAWQLDEAEGDSLAIVTSHFTEEERRTAEAQGTSVEERVARRGEAFVGRYVAVFRAVLSARLRRERHPLRARRPGSEPRTEEAKGAEWEMYKAMTALGAMELACDPKPGKALELALDLDNRRLDAASGLHHQPRQDDDVVMSEAPLERGFLPLATVPAATAALNAAEEEEEVGEGSDPTRIDSLELAGFLGASECTDDEHLTEYVDALEASDEELESALDAHDAALDARSMPPPARDLAKASGEHFGLRSDVTAPGERKMADDEVSASTVMIGSSDGSSSSIASTASQQQVRKITRQLEDERAKVAHLEAALRKATGGLVDPASFVDRSPLFDADGPSRSSVTPPTAQGAAAQSAPPAPPPAAPSEEAGGARDATCSGGGGGGGGDVLMSEACESTRPIAHSVRLASPRTYRPVCLRLRLTLARRMCVCALSGRDRTRSKQSRTRSKQSRSGRHRQAPPRLCGVAPLQTRRPRHACGVEQRACRSAQRAWRSAAHCPRHIQHVQYRHSHRRQLFRTSLWRHQ